MVTRQRSDALSNNTDVILMPEVYCNKLHCDECLWGPKLGFSVCDRKPIWVMYAQDNVGPLAA